MSEEKGKKVRISDVTDKDWEVVNKTNKALVSDFLKQKNASLSQATIKQYTSGLQIFARWIHNEFGEEKKITDLKPRNALQYITFLDEAGLSPAAIKFKVACASSLMLYITRYYDDEYPTFKNIFSGVEKPAKAPVHEKKPLTKEEYHHLVRELEGRGLWLMASYLMVSFVSGCRRAEARQLLKEVIHYDKIKGKNYYLSHSIRGKGRGREGKKIQLTLDDEAMGSIKKWLEIRGEDDCPYVFAVKDKNGKYRQVSMNTFNYWCSSTFSEIMGRRIYPHLSRTSRASSLKNEDKKDIKSIQALLNHSDPSTTSIYIISENDELDDIF